MSDLHEALTDLKANCPPQLTSIAMRLVKAINDQSIEKSTLRHGLDLADRRYQALEKQNAELLAALHKVAAAVQQFKSDWQKVPYFADRVNKTTREAMRMAFGPIVNLDAVGGPLDRAALQPSTQEVSK